jgi:hypothetical protein
MRKSWHLLATCCEFRARFPRGKAVRCNLMIRQRWKLALRTSQRHYHWIPGGPQPPWPTAVPNSLPWGAGRPRFPGARRGGVPGGPAAEELALEGTAGRERLANLSKRTGTQTFKSGTLCLGASCQRSASLNLSPEEWPNRSPALVCWPVKDANRRHPSPAKLAKGRGFILKCISASPAVQPVLCRLHMMYP